MHVTQTGSCRRVTFSQVQFTPLFRNGLLFLVHYFQCNNTIKEQKIFLDLRNTIKTSLYRKDRKEKKLIACFYLLLIASLSIKSLRPVLSYKKKKKKKRRRRAICINSSWNVHYSRWATALSQHLYNQIVVFWKGSTSGFLAIHSAHYCGLRDCMKWRRLTLLLTDAGSVASYHSPTLLASGLTFRTC